MFEFYKDYIIYLDSSSVIMEDGEQFLKECDAHVKMPSTVLAELEKHNVSCLPLLKKRIQEGYVELCDTTLFADMFFSQMLKLGQGKQLLITQDRQLAETIQQSGSLVLKFDKNQLVSWNL